MTTQDKKRFIVSFASAFVLGLCLALSVVLWRGNDAGVRRVFVFERSELQSMGQPRLAMEARYLVRGSAQGDIKSYVDDLVLGPVTHGLLPLFAPGTRVTACFVRSGVLYLDLNSALLHVNGHTSTIGNGVALLKKNILLNFRGIQEVKVFVDGAEAYSD